MVTSLEIIGGFKWTKRCLIGLGSMSEGTKLLVDEKYMLINIRCEKQRLPG